MKRRKEYEKELDPTFAPEGCIAVPQKDPKEPCPGCLFEGNSKCGMDLHCCASERPDGWDVIFVRK